LLDRFRKDLTVCHSLILRNTAFTECLFLARFELIIMAVSHYEGGNMHFEKIQYFFDPLCGWCYASAPALGYLAQHYAEKLELMPSGLFSDEGARTSPHNGQNTPGQTTSASHPSPASRSARTIISFC
jgi:hypothetical protein